MKIIFFHNILKRVPKYFWILLVIIFIGAFLRAYNFHDWLRFNADQGRDAEVVSKFLNGNIPLPLLGPKAGGTEFSLGPAFYYFEIVSAKIFGNYPDKMAYPDLATSILCIPLLFFFLRKYFEKNTALSITAIFAISEYAIYFSRFAWNPNSEPFWTILALYAIHGIISQKNNRKFLWSMVAGIAIGIGVQLHTTLLLFLPITTIIVFGYLAFKNVKILKYFFVILAMSLFLNVPQIIHEYQHHGENVRAFFEGAKKKQEKVSFVEKLLHNSSCFVQGNVDIISGYEISDICEFKPEKNKNDLAIFILGTFFVIGGIIFGLRYLKKELDPDKKYFLALIFIYITVAYLIFIPIAFELSMRFYLALIFLPFLLFGFWWKFIVEKNKYYPTILMMFLCVFLLFSNLYFVHKYFVELANYGKNGGTNLDVTILQETEAFSQFIVANSDNEKTVYVGGNAKFLFKSYNSIRYLVNKSGIDLLLINREHPLPSQYFYVNGINEEIKDLNRKVLDSKAYGSLIMLLVQNIAPSQQ